MNNFLFENKTKVYFGKGGVKEYLGCLLEHYGDTVMLAYGGGSIKHNGVYDEIVGILNAEGKRIVEFPGIMPNPTYAKVQEGETPAEDPLRLIGLLNAECSAYEELIRRINLTNAATVLDGQTLTALLARRDALSLEISILRDFLQQASQRIDRYSKTEIKILSTVDVTAMQKTVDAKSKELRQLDAAIQKLNWNTTLI